MDLEVEHIGN